MWFGYCLTGDISQHKFALFVGPPRSGKGTVLAVLTRTLGSYNVANPTLSSLGSRFGLAPLMGKLAAVVGDGHLGRQADATAILERLKSIVGGDAQNVDRKHLSELGNVTLRARFSIAVNEIPRLPDSSVALRSRMLVFPFEVSFEGREDFGLGDRLAAEIPGVTNWALGGLLELRRRGRLIQPDAGQAILDSFTRLSSPVQSFQDECCVIGRDLEVRCRELFAAWKSWCEQNGHRPGSDSSFGSKLKAAIPHLERTRLPREDGKQPYVYRGLQLMGAM
jgi:putative DNA primase/helicase